MKQPATRVSWRLSGRLRVLMLTLALLGILAACGQAAGDPAVLDTSVTFNTTALEELSPRPSYRIGINAEITGTGASIGDLGVRAARLAVEEINAAGGVNGVPLELVVRDCRSDPEEALVQYRLALAEDRLTALIGPFKSAYAVRIVPEHRQARLPMLIGATNATLTDHGGPFLFRMRPSDRLTSAAMTALAVEELGSRRIVIVHDADAFGTGGANGVEAGLRQRGLRPLAREAYRTGTRDFDALARRVAEAGPDAVLIYGTNTTDVGLLLRALRYWQVRGAIITSPGGASAVTYGIAAEAQEGIYVALDALLAATPEGARFERRFYERFGLKPDTYVAWYYDAVHLLAMALERRPRTAEELRAAVREQTFTGVQGRYRFDERGEGLHEVVLATMRAGQPRLVGVYGEGGLRRGPVGSAGQGGAP
ncbi:MAG: ABC transporter substrate-binding protein [Oscillochloridaceae bacterium]|nr:ABC transporter substrate-binding protein [Chloroflexaceae bacterium]MDW8391860.1 ABC transporter substrate-binding protein [Oscillochloridaceae bacterium]